MHSLSVSKLPVSLRTRLLSYSLLSFCVAMTLFGPQVSEFALRALGCGAKAGAGAAECPGVLSGPLAHRLSGWLSAESFVESGFTLLDRLWGLIAVWLALIVASVSSDRRSEALRVVQLEAYPEPQPALQPEPQPTEPGARGQQLRARQAELLRLQMAEQQALRQQEQSTQAKQQRAQHLGSFASIVLWWVLLGGLVAFCIAFGIPLLGGLSADFVLGALDCSGPSHDSGRLCGFWGERLLPYRQPIVGALFAPFWLLTQFIDLLLIWLGLILALGAVIGVRIGSWVVRSNR